MRVWLLSFVVLFGVAELYQWLVGFAWWHQAELPMMIVAGTALAIASNYNKWVGLPWHDASQLDLLHSRNSQVQPSVSSPTPQAQPSAALPSSAQLQQPQLPNFEFDLRPRKSISFTIRQPGSSLKGEK